MIKTYQLVDSIVNGNPDLAKQHRAGAEAFRELMRQAMVAGRGHHNPALVERLLKEKLGGIDYDH